MDIQSALSSPAERQVASSSPPCGPVGGVRKNAAGKRRGKTFTGCWTCRSRHVKCDEKRPSCQRCSVGNFKCQGYGTRLTWVSEGRKVRSGDECGPPARNKAGKDADVIILADRSSRDRSELRKHSKSGASTSPGEAQSGSHLSSDQQATIPAYNDSNSDHAIRHDATIPGCTVGGTCVFPNDRQTINTLNATPGAAALDALAWSDTPDSDRVFGNDHGAFGTSSPFIHGVPSPGYFGMPSSSNLSAPQRALINHWVTNLAHKLVPIRSAVNPLLTVASPMALRGSYLQNGETSSSAAVFHAICALSAIHQENLIGRRSGGVGALAVYHKRLSFQHLMKNIGSNDTDDRMASLATLCIWLLAHFVSGTAGAWRELVRVTRNLLAQTSMDTWTKTVTASLTYQSFASSFTLIQCQYVGHADFPGPMKTDLAGDNISRNLAMPDNSLQLVSAFNMKLLGGAPMHHGDLDQLEMEFALTTPIPSTDLDTETPDSTTMHHHRLLFYYACLLYFRCNSGRRGLEDEVQSLVDRCLGHMEQLDALQLDISPRAWIFASVAFEAGTAELRERVRASFNKRMQLGICSWDTPPC